MNTQSGALGALGDLEGARRRVELLAGIGAVVAVHLGVVGAIVMTPARTRTEVDSGMDDGPCTSVVSPSCCGGRVQDTGGGSVGEPGTRRCPEPMRRRQRRRPEDAPASTVDLLQAQLIERLGSETGKLPPTTRAEHKPQQTKEERRRRKISKIVQGGELKKIFKGGKTSRARRSKLGSILGKATGRKDGDALVSRKGSAYVREVRIAMQNAFVLPGQVPVWLRKELRARVRITRMTATGRVLAYRVERKSGNDAFDKTVRSLMARYKSGLRTLPAPPPHILTEINSRGMRISLRGG